MGQTFGTWVVASSHLRDLLDFQIRALDLALRIQESAGGRVGGDAVDDDAMLELLALAAAALPAAALEARATYLRGLAAMLAGPADATVLEKLMGYVATMRDRSLSDLVHFVEQVGTSRAYLILATGPSSRGIEVRFARQLPPDLKTAHELD